MGSLRMELSLDTPRRGGRVGPLSDGESPTPMSSGSSGGGETIGLDRWKKRLEALFGFVAVEEGEPVA
jgi:hypothetical protein